MIGIKTFTKPFKQVAKALSPVADSVGSALNTSIGGDSAVGRGLTEASQGVVKTIEDVPKILEQVTEASLAQARAFVKDPIPTLATIALSQFIPYNYASAIVNVANGGDWKKAVIQMGMDYYTRDLNTGVPKSTLEKVFTSASTSALSAKLLGATDREVINAAIGGAVNTYVSDVLYKPESQGGFGLDPNSITSKMMTNATSATTNAILRGQPIGDAIIQSAMVTAGTYYTKKSFDAVTKNSETLRAAQKYVDETKAKVKSLWTPSLQDKKEKVEQAEMDYARTSNQEPLRKQEAQMALDIAKGDFATESFEYRSALMDYNYYYGVAKAAESSLSMAQTEFLYDEGDLGYSLDKASVFNQEELDQMVSSEIDLNKTDETANYLQKERNFDRGAGYSAFESTLASPEELEQEIQDDPENNFYVRQSKRIQAEADAYDLANPGWRTRTAEESEALRQQEVAERLRLQKLVEEQNAQVKAAQTYDKPQDEYGFIVGPDGVAYYGNKTQAEAAKAADLAEKLRLQKLAEDQDAQLKAAQAYAKEMNDRQAQEEDARRADQKAKDDAKIKEEEDYKKYVADLLEAEKVDREQKAQVEAAKAYEADRIAQEEAAKDLAYPGWREALAKSQADAAYDKKYPGAREAAQREREREEDQARQKAEYEALPAREKMRLYDPEAYQQLRAQEIAEAYRKEQEEQVEAARKLREEAQAKAKAEEDERYREFDSLMPGVREETDRIGKAQSDRLNMFTGSPQERKELLNLFASQNARMFEEQNAQYAKALQERDEAKVKEQQRLDFEKAEIQRVEEEKQAKAKADLLAEQKAEEQKVKLAAELEARQKAQAQADLLAEQQAAQQKAKDEAELVAKQQAEAQAKLVAEQQAKAKADEDAKQTEIGAAISRAAAAAAAAAINKKIAEDKAAEARAEAMAKQEAARAQAKAAYDEKVRLQQEAQAKAKAEYDAKVKAQAEAKAAAAAKAKADYDEKVRLKAEYDAKVKAEADAKADAYAKAKAAYDEKIKLQLEAQAKAKAEADARNAAAKAAYDEKVRLKAEYDAKVKAAADAKAATPASQLPLSSGTTPPAGTLTPVAKPTGTLTPVTAPTGTLTPVTKPVAPTGGLTPVTKPTGTLTPAAPAGGLTPVTKPTTPVTPTGGLTAVTKPVTTTPVTSLPTKPTSTTIAPPTGTLTPVTKPPTGGLTPVVKPPTGTLTPVAKPAGTLTPVTKPTGTLTPAIKPTGALTSVVKPTGTLTPV